MSFEKFKIYQNFIKFLKAAIRGRQGPSRVVRGRRGPSRTVGAHQRPSWPLGAVMAVGGRHGRWGRSWPFRAIEVPSVPKCSIWAMRGHDGPMLVLYNSSRIVCINFFYTNLFTGNTFCVKLIVKLLKKNTQF